MKYVCSNSLSQSTAPNGHTAPDAVKNFAHHVFLMFVRDRIPEPLHQIAQRLFGFQADFSQTPFVGI